MIAEDYNLYGKVDRTEKHECPAPYYGYRHTPFLSFLRKTETRHNPKELDKDGVDIGGKQITYQDPNDVPLFGQYFLRGAGSYCIPIEKIAGKNLIFGVRGTCSTNRREADNGKYTGTIQLNKHGKASEQSARLRISNLRILPIVYPEIKTETTIDQNGEEIKTATWKVTSNSMIKLRTGQFTNKDKWDNTGGISLARYGERYYASCDWCGRS